MSEAHMFCPACETRIRFPSGLPDRDWIECPRCGEEIPLSRPSRSRRRSSRRDRDRDDYDARSRRERPSRRRPAPARSERPRELASESAGGSAGLWVGLIGGAVGVLGVILGVIFFVNADKDQAPAAKPDQVADAADQNPAIDTDRVPNAREQFVANFPPHRPNAAPVAGGNPTPTMGPGPDGIIPAPPAAGNQDPIINDSNTLKYGWKPGQQFAYRTTVKAEIGDEVNEVHGMSTYKVVGRDPGLARLAQEEDEEEQQGSGTGFVVHHDGYIMTCAHVVDDADTIEVELDNRKYAARVIEINSQRDIALIRIAARNLPVLPLSDSSRIQLAQPVRVVGFPLSDVLGTSVKITQGSVAGFIDRKTGRMIQVDASMNPGNSGGPLVNDRGEVIGVASAGYFGSEISEVGLAVPSNEVGALLRKHNITPLARGAVARLEGPELARRVTPSVAYLKVTIGSAKKNSLVLEYSSSHSTTKRRKDGRAVIGGSVSRPQSDHGRLMVDDFGSILFAESSKDTLPYGLGPLSHLPIEPLSPKGESSWATRRLTTITHTQRDQSRYDPFSRFGSGSPFRSRSRSRFGPRGIPRPPSPFDRGGSEVKKVYLATEIAAYELAETNPQTQVISKHYDFRTIDDSDKPHVRLYGDGNIRFDRSKRLCDQISFHLNLEVRGDDGKSALVPVEVFCERLTDQELDERNRRTADLVKKSQQQAQARAAMTIDDHLAAITDPNKSSSEKYYSLSRLKTTTPNDQKRKAVLDAVKPNLDSKDALVRNGSIDVFGRWATEAEAKTLIDLVTHADTSVRFSAIRALGKIGGAKAASALVGRLTVSTDGSVAASALQKMGEIVEDPVLKLIDHPDERVRYQVYRILGKVGGAKSLAALKKKSEPHTVYRAVANASMQEIGRRLKKMN